MEKNLKNFITTVTVDMVEKLSCSPEQVYKLLN